MEKNIREIIIEKIKNGSRVIVEIINEIEEVRPGTAK